MLTLDLYRLEAGDVEGLAMEECLDSGVVAVEWAERVPLWPEGIRITLHVVGEKERKIVMEVEDAGRAQIWRHFRRES